MRVGRTFLALALGGAVLLGAHPAYADSKSEARRYFSRGMAAIDAGQYREGIQLLEKAYEVRPHRNVLFNIARAYVSLGDLDQAIDYFERYLDENPPDRAQIQATLKELKERAELRRLVDRGMSAIQAGRPIEGIALLGRAYEIRPHPNLLFNIGQAYEEADEPEQAMVAYRRYLRTKPRDAAQVEARVARLEKALSARTARRRRATPRRSGGAPVVRPTKPEPAPARPPAETRTAPSALSQAQIDAIAEAVAARLRDRAPDPASTVPSSTVGSGLAVLPLDGAGASSGVALEAKGGEQYEEVVVTASRRPQSPLDAPNAVTILTEEDIRLSGARNIPDLLRRVPGVDVMQMSYSDYNVAVRGFNRRVANKILVLVDNRTVYADFLGVTTWNYLPIELIDIERIEVVRGPGSAVYGAYAYTGIINIITKRPDELEGVVAQVAAGNGDVLEGSFQYGERFGRVGVRVSGGYQQGQKFEIDFDERRPDVSTPLEDVDRSNQIVRANALLEYYIPGEASSRLYLGGSVVEGPHELFGVANLRNLAADGVELRARAGFESELFTLRSFFARIDRTAEPQSFSTGLTPFFSTVVNDVFSIEPIFRPRFELAGEHRMVIGGEYRFKAIDWDFLNDAQTENHFAVYFQDDWRLSRGLSVVLSGRFDLHPLIGPLGSPRAALIFRTAPGQALRLSLGTAFRVPTMAETYLALSSQVPSNPGTAVTLVGGDEDLDPEGIATVDLGYRIEWDAGSFETVAWFNRVTDLIVRTPLEATGSSARFIEALDAYEVARSFYVNDTRSFLAVGGELDIQLNPLDGFDIGGSYAFQYIFDEDTGDQFTDSPVHKASLWGQIRTTAGLDLGLSGHFVSDQQWVEPDFDPNSPTGFDAAPLPVDAYVTLMARIGYRVLDDKLELFVSGANLLDVGDSRRREHPFANRLQARIVAGLTGRL